MATCTGQDTVPVQGQLESTLGLSVGWIPSATLQHLHGLDLGADFKVLYTQEKYTTCAVERLVDSGHVCVTSTQNKSTGITVTSQDSGNLGALGIPVSCSGFVLGAGVLENGTIGS